MVTTQVLGSTVVHDVRAMLQRPLQVRAHHRVIDDDQRVRSIFVHELTDSSDIRNLEEGIRRGFEEDHRDFRVGRGEEGKDGGRVGRRDVVGDDAVVRLEVRQETV